MSILRLDVLCAVICYFCSILFLFFFFAQIHSSLEIGDKKYRQISLWCIHIPIPIHTMNQPLCQQFPVEERQKKWDFFTQKRWKLITDVEDKKSFCLIKKNRWKKKLLPILRSPYSPAKVALSDNFLRFFGHRKKKKIREVSETLKQKQVNAVTGEWSKRK